MAPFDWVMVLLPLAIVVVTGIYAQQYVKSVADFLSANRSAGRYLLCISGAELQTGAVVFVSAFEVFAHGGPAYGWWNAIVFPVGIILGLSGFVTYRFRQTRAMTLAQFFEIRYNKSFRLFTGLLAFFAGMLNFGIIPAIGARTMVYFLGFPENVRILSVIVPTYVPLMAVFLFITAFVAVSGGVVTVMLITTIEGIMSQIFYLFIIFALLSMFSWPQMHAVLIDRPPGKSMLNPFDTSRVNDFNIWNVLMATVIGIITVTGISWQNSGAHKSAGLTPHEGRMGGILSGWLGMGKGAVVTLLALASYTYLHHPDFSSGAARVHATVNLIANKQAQEEMTAPIALAYLLPLGVKGMFCAILLMGIFGGDATHLHSWGSIFIQDVLVPLRKERFGPRVHLLVLRCSILGVACFAFFLGTFFHLNDYISMWFGVTQAIFCGGAGPAIIGGLYWKKGTGVGAWAGFITGSTLALAGIFLQQYYSFYNEHFFLNGTQISFVSTLISVSVYIIVSLLTCTEDFNIDRMLHRGEYAALTTLVSDNTNKRYKRGKIATFIGLDDDFSPSDKWLAGGVFGWQTLLFVIFVIGTIWNLAAPWPLEVWATYYHIMGIGLPIAFAFITGIWFTWGGLRDMRALFRRLSTERVNVLDDGTVVGNRNLDELAVEAKASDAPVASRVEKSEI